MARPEVFDKVVMRYLYQANDLTVVDGFPRYMNQLLLAFYHGFISIGRASTIVVMDCTMEGSIERLRERGREDDFDPTIVVKRYRQWQDGGLPVVDWLRVHIPSRVIFIPPHMTENHAYFFLQQSLWYA